jgi:hypothetical protein
VIEDAVEHTDERAEGGVLRLNSLLNEAR